MLRLYKFFIIIVSYLLLNMGMASEILAMNYLKELVRFKTVSNNNEEIQRSYQWILEQVENLPVYTAIETYSGVPSLLITTQKTKTPYVWLVAHMDVVAAPESLFEARKEEDKLIGRGVLDMKFAIAVGLAILQALGDDLVDYNFGLMITADEEIGGANGVKALLEDGYSSDIVFIPDGGFNWEIEEQAKGAVHYEVSATGVSAHGSRPWLGKNAIWRLIHFLEDVEALFIELKDNDEYFPTVNVGKIEGGVATNQVPDVATAHLDIRYPSTISMELIEARMNELVSLHPDIRLERNLSVSAVFNDSNHYAVREFKQLAKQCYGINIGTMRAHGASDARYFGEVGIPALIISPTGGGIHSLDEWIGIEDMERFYQVSKQWIKMISRNK